MSSEPPRLPKQPAAPFRCAIEAVAASPSGGVLVLGWVADDAPLAAVRVATPAWAATFEARALVATRRDDVAERASGETRRPRGFLGLLHLDRPLGGGSVATAEIVLDDGAGAAITTAVRRVGDDELRDLAMTCLAAARFASPGPAAAVDAIDACFGGEAVALHRAVVAGVAAAPYVERFGAPPPQPAGSIVVCLFGKPEFLFLQAALFSAGPGIDAYEWIYVCNSPEMAEALLREARSVHRLYGPALTMVILAGNAGFGAANNAAARFARSDRLLFVNPDVFPRDPEWARAHARIVESAPAEQTRLFGATLFYGDGALMHAGLRFELDRAMLLDGDRPRAVRLARVEHVDKGAPAGAAATLAARPAPGVSGAFLSLSRPWFERHGGFTESYVFGHYEDADLCLKSLQAGTPAWLHPLELWHLEGKGSTRLAAHEGGAIVNRWLFTRAWGDVLAGGLCGPTPSHPLLSRRPPAGSPGGGGADGLALASEPAE